MAQLTPDALAFDGPLLSIDQALASLARRLSPLVGTERVRLSQATGRVLAFDIIAGRALPPFNNSAVDGYAVRLEDVAREGRTRLAIMDRVTAGAAARVEISKGQAARVFTGAPMPPGTDTVYMQEDVLLEAGAVFVPSGLKRGANARFTGEDVSIGQTVLSAGQRLRSQDIGLAAALGISEIVVRSKLRVAVFSTGDEVIEPGEPLGEAGIYDANRAMLCSMLAQAGCDVMDHGIVRDDRAALSARLKSVAGSSDLILTSGGVSTGEEDHVKAAVEAVGRLDLWRLAIKPGRPVALGIVANAVFCGVPGNPVAAFVTTARIVRPLIAILAGETWVPPRAYPVVSGFAYRKKAGRREYVRVSLTAGADGRFTATKHRQDGAGVITSLTETHGLVELSDDLTSVAEGDIVPFLGWDGLI
jgi:molybdopterin molybdotransferase